jgi:hypothetical protein
MYKKFCYKNQPEVGKAKRFLHIGCWKSERPRGFFKLVAGSQKKPAGGFFKNKKKQRGLWIYFGHWKLEETRWRFLQPTNVFMTYIKTPIVTNRPPIPRIAPDAPPTWLDVLLKSSKTVGSKFKTANRPTMPNTKPNIKFFNVDASAIYRSPNYLYPFVLIKKL